MRRLTSVMAAVGLVGAGLFAATPIATADESPNSDPTQVVSYRGYEVEVPASWRVIDLEANPDTCVRFDVATIYLGHPDPDYSCPPDTAADTSAGVIVKPLDATAIAPVGVTPMRVPAGSATPPDELPGDVWADGSIDLAVEGAGVLVTGHFAADRRGEVAGVLDTATVTADANPATLRSAERAVRERQPERADAQPAEVPVQPGTYTGRGFDACNAPSASTMDSWWQESPYRVLGIYTSGRVRLCADQPNLTASWLEGRTATGWKFTPIHVGPQAPASCNNRSYSAHMSINAATAEQQGREEADEAVAAAQALGIPPGSAIYLDIEAYNRGGDCTQAVLAHTSGWTEQLHGHGYLSGFYSSAASGISDLNAAWGNTEYTLPDHLWFAWWNGQADVNGGQYLDANKWANGQRIHQYVGDNRETYGGVTIQIDRNYMELAEGDVTPDVCVTTNLDFDSYPALASGDSGEQVTAAQCLLTRAGFATGEDDPTGAVDEPTVSAITEYQESIDLDATGEVDAHTWTALLSRGTTPTVQNGSSGEAVRRLQRALTAALGSTVQIDGQFGPNTEAAVEQYQQSRNLDVDGIAGPQTWGALQSGQ